MRLKEVFFPDRPPSEDMLVSSRKIMLAESATASTIFALGTGNFLAGFLVWMGAAPSYCAIVAALPQLGSLLQLFAPFLFERMRHRKLYICLLCFGFRLSLGTTLVIPFLFSSGPVRLGAVFVLYFIGFAFAGFVTPGLNQWLLGVAPSQNRGRFFAARDIISSLFNAGIMFTMGAQLDYFIRKGTPLTGYCIVFGTILFMAAVNIILLCNIREIPATQSLSLRFRDFLTPIKDVHFRPIILFLALWAAAANFSNAFLPVYQLKGLGLSHRYISVCVIAASVAGIAGSWLWGILADRRGWRVVLLMGGSLSTIGYLGWCLTTPAIAIFSAPVLQCFTTSGASALSMAGLNLQFATSPRKGTTVYLAAAAIISNLAGYCMVIISSRIQPLLEPVLGVRSMSVLFAVSAAAMLVCLIQGNRSLPRH